MNTRYRLILRNLCGGICYAVNKATGNRTSLQTAGKNNATGLN